MARAKGWYTVDGPSGSVTDQSFQTARVIAAELVNPTLLRTRAFFSLATAQNDGPPFTIGNAHAPQIFRIVVTAQDDPPDELWPGEPEGVDDVIFHPLVWQTGLYVPGNVGFGRPEEVFCVANPAGGVADSAAERKMLGTVNVLASWYAGPALRDVQPADPQCTVNYWIRCLIEADI
jgi:hypothetical protein